METDENGNVVLEDSPSQGISIHAGSSSGGCGDGRSGPRMKTEVRWGGQLKGVLKKNFRLYTRKKSSWVSVVILPLFFMVITYLYTGFLMAIEKPSEAFRDPITNYPTVPLPSFSSTLSAAQCTLQKTPCILAVSPDDTETRAFASEVRAKLADNSTGRMPPLAFYENSTALHDAINADGPRFFGGISFHGKRGGGGGGGGGSAKVDFRNYTLYMKSTLLPQDGYGSMPSIYSGEVSSMVNASLYVRSGFATLQSAVDLSVVNSQRGAEGLGVTLRTRILPGWEANPLSSMIGLFICIMVLVSYSPLLTNGATLITNENLSKTRQYLFTLGLRRWVYWLSWVLTLFVPSLVIAALWIACGVAGSTLSGSGAVYMAFYYALFSVSIIMVIFIVQCLVKSVMWSTAISSAFLVLPPVIGSLLPSIKWVQSLVSLFSSYTLFLAVSNTTAEKMHGASASALGSTEVILWVIFDSVLYGVIAWYLNEVFTGDYGVSKGPLFVFDKTYWRNFFGRPARTNVAEDSYPESESESESEEDENFEKTSNDAEAGGGRRRGARTGILLRGLTKSFNGGSVVAVDSASGSFRRGKITCLLGQNGAGKTTLISTLYGLIEPSAGTAFIDGRNIATDIDLIRSSIGVCPQDDILYSELTAQDHIDLVMALKGVPKADENGEYVKRLMEDLALFEGADQKAPVSAYSGGMKRKLSLIMSLIGDSKGTFSSFHSITFT